MDITEIIKDAFMFPSKDFGKLTTYIVITIVACFFSIGAIFKIAFGIILSDNTRLLIGLALLIIAIILGLVIKGYQISIIKSGIEEEETVPEYELKRNLLNGIKFLILDIIYFIIPAIVLVVVGLISNVPGNINAIVNQVKPAIANMTNPSTFSSYYAANATMPSITIPDALITNLAISLLITLVVGIIVFLIFAFIKTMAEARLAKTDSLAYSLNIIESFNDIGRIGWGKVIATFIAIIIVIMVINTIFGIICSQVRTVWILNMILAPYLMFFSLRALGLLYSDIDMFKLLF